MSQRISRDTDKSHRHLDCAPRELKSEKAISFSSRISKYPEADIALGQGPVSLTFPLQTPSPLGSYICAFVCGTRTTRLG